MTAESAGPPFGGLYLKPPSSGGLCDGVITTPSARPLPAPAVVHENRAGDDRRGREAAVALENGFDTVRGEHFERRVLRRTR